MKKSMLTFIIICLAALLLSANVAVCDSYIKSPSERAMLLNSDEVLKDNTYLIDADSSYAVVTLESVRIPMDSPRQKFFERLINQIKEREFEVIAATSVTCQQLTDDGETTIRPLGTLEINDGKIELRSGRKQELIIGHGKKVGAHYIPGSISDLFVKVRVAVLKKNVREATGIFDQLGALSGPAKVKTFAQGAAPWAKVVDIFLDVVDSNRSEESSGRTFSANIQFLPYADESANRLYQGKYAVIWPNEPKKLCKTFKVKHINELYQKMKLDGDRLLVDGKYLDEIDPKIIWICFGVIKHKLPGFFDPLTAPKFQETAAEIRNIFKDGEAAKKNQQEVKFSVELKFSEYRKYLYGRQLYSLQHCGQVMDKLYKHTNIGDYSKNILEELKLEEPRHSKEIADANKIDSPFLDLAVTDYAIWDQIMRSQDFLVEKSSTFFKDPEALETEPEYAAINAESWNSHIAGLKDDEDKPKDFDESLFYLPDGGWF